jgi:hypothetical protein
MSTPAAAIPAPTNHQNPSRLKTISCPLDFITNVANALTKKAASEITIAPRTGVGLEDFRKRGRGFTLGNCTPLSLYPFLQAIVIELQYRGGQAHAKVDCQCHRRFPQ